MGDVGAGNISVGLCWAHIALYAVFGVSVIKAFMCLSFSQWKGTAKDKRKRPHIFGLNIGWIEMRTSTWGKTCETEAIIWQTLSHFLKDVRGWNNKSTENWRWKEGKSVGWKRHHLFKTKPTRPRHFMPWYLLPIIPSIFRNEIHSKKHRFNQ